MGENFELVILAQVLRFVMILCAVLAFLFVGEPDLHDAIIDLVKSWTSHD